MANPRLRVVNMVTVEEGTRINNAPRSLRSAQYMRNPCTICPARCCATSVLLSTVEAQRIAMTLGLPLHDVAELRARSDVQPTMADPPVIPLSDGEWHFQLVRSLETLSCVFVLTAGGQQRCGIYGLRPHICAFYPAHLDVDGKPFIVGNQSRCPTAWMKTDALESSLAERFTAYQQDHAHERALLDAWAAHDAADRSLAAYTAFSQQWCAHTLGFPLPEALPVVTRKRLGPALW